MLFRADHHNERDREIVDLELLIEAGRRTTLGSAEVALQASSPNP
jgi:hypothetical protein